MLVHATSVVLAQAARPFGGEENAAVLLLGESSSGKSDLALRLIALGARLLSDDQTRLTVEHGRLIADAPERIRGLIEIRGAGIVRLEPAGPSPVALAARLDGAAPARLPAPESYANAALGPFAAPPMIALDPFTASAAARIAAAASAASRGRFVAGVAPPK